MSFGKFLSSISTAITNVTTQVTAATQQQQTVQIGNKSFVIKQTLGEGGFAFVYSVEDTISGQNYALKRILAQDSENITIAEKEITIMKQLRNQPYIVQYYGASKREVTHPMKATEFFILMEYCGQGSLIDLIKRQQSQHSKLPEKTICSLFIQICKAVQCLHTQSPPICHRDLKIENILIGQDGTIKLCDFGSCTTRVQAYHNKSDLVAEEERISKYSTAMYRAPEMTDLYQRIVVSEKVDIWAVGCILYVLAFFIHPFQEGSTLQILSGNYEIPEQHSYSKYLIALIKRLLVVDPSKRPDIAQVLQLCEQWKEWLKSGKADKVAKPAMSRSATEGTTTSVHAATGPTPSHFTSPSKPDTETDSTPVKHKKKKSSKGSSTLHVASSDGFGSDWNPFPSSEPTSAPPVVQHTATTGSKSAHKSKSSSKHIVSATPEPEAPKTAFLFDTSLLADAFHSSVQVSNHNNNASGSQPSNSTSNSNWANFSPANNTTAKTANDDWAEFDAFPQNGTTQQAQPAQQHAADAFAGFDFSGGRS